MRKKFFIAVLLMALSITGVWAEERSEREAQMLAMRFVSGLFDGQYDDTELTYQGQICGLYVFSLGEQGGFIIVSNDDRTLPILGFSENGTLDMENMSDEQRAWLQGYADEIVWLQQHNYGETPSDTLPQIPSDTLWQTRGGSHAKEAIEPLVTTAWNQRSPYNDLCPEYAPGKKAVTGCVATAMAQVMNYHKWPVAETNAIPGYRDGYGVDHLPLEATTFDWDNMLDSYNGSETAEQNTAVAKLMLYGGYSVEMNYGPSSGSYIIKVATALKNYFDYNSTATYISRSSYSNDKWEDIIYHELASKRPVLMNWPPNVLCFMAVNLLAVGMPLSATATGKNTPPTTSTSTGAGAAKATNTTSCPFLTLIQDKASEAVVPMAVSTTDRKPSSAYRSLLTTER